MSGATPGSCRAPGCHVLTCLVPTCLVPTYPELLCQPGPPAPQGGAPGREAPRESRAGAFEQEFREQADSNRRRPLGVARRFALEVGGPGDVEVDPRKAVDELAQEPRARDRAGGASARILHVGYVGLEQLAVLIPQRQRPAALAGALARIAHLGEQRLDRKSTRL